MESPVPSGHAQASSSCAGEGAACRAGDKRGGEAVEGAVVKRRPGEASQREGTDCAFIPASPRWKVRRGPEAPPRGGQAQALGAMGRGLWQQADSRSEKLTDVRFLFPCGAALHAHRGVLASRSRALRGMFESDMDEARTGEVRIGDCSPASFRAFLSHMYLGALAEDCRGAADGRELWVLADKYEVEDLREYLLADVDEVNVGAAAQFAREVRDGCLSALCEQRARALLRLITANALRGIESTVAWALMPENGQGLDAFLFAQRWFEANGGGADGHVQPLVRKVDFSTISSLDLRAVVRPSGLVSAERLVDLYEKRLGGFPWASQDFRPMSFRGEGILNTPVGIASRDDSTVLVADRMNSRVLVLGPNDYSVLLPKDANSVKLRDPVGIALGPSGNIAVTDVRQERVLEFTAEGDFVQAFGTAGKGDGQFSGLRGIAINRAGEFIVSDENNHRIQMFASDGTFLRAFGTLGHDSGQLSRPFGVAVSPDGTIIVADQGNARIAEFTPQGTFVRAFGLPFLPGEGLMDPAFVAVHISGDIVVSDFARDRVHVFSAEGVLLKTIGGEGEVQFLGPCGVAVGSNGSIIVADSGHSRLSILGTV